MDLDLVLGIEDVILIGIVVLDLFFIWEVI